MSDLKPTSIKIKLGDKEYGLLCSINVIDDIQDHLDMPFSKLFEVMQDERRVFKILRYILTAMINEALDDEESDEPHVTERFIGRKITAGNISQLRSGVIHAISTGVPEPSDDDEEDDPNATSGQ